MASLGGGRESIQTGETCYKCYSPWFFQLKSFGVMDDYTKIEKIGEGRCPLICPSDASSLRSLMELCYREAYGKKLI